MLDKTIWQAALANYQDWNETRFKERLQQAGQKSQAQKWQEYLALLEFGLQIRAQPTANEQWRKLENLERYYELIQQFEQKRQPHE